MEKDNPQTTPSYQPWVEFSADIATLPPELPIKAPPCAKCKFWNPRRMFEVLGDTRSSGVRLCHAQDMHHDFSCFKDKMDKPC